MFVAANIGAMASTVLAVCHIFVYLESTEQIQQISLGSSDRSKHKPHVTTGTI